MSATTLHEFTTYEAAAMGIEVAHLEAHASLPLHHRDPFDRMLIVQAQSHGLIVLAQDSIFARYDVQVLLN